MISPVRAGWHVGRVARKSRETDTAVRLTLDVPTWPGNLAGSHIDVRLTAPDGYQATRSYSIASSGSSSQVSLAVDEVVDGEVSPFLVHDLAVGEQVEVHGPLGRFFVWTPDDPDTSPVQLIGGGSGVVPLFAMASARERSEYGADFRLLYSVRSPSSVFFEKELAALEKVGVDIIYTREAPAGSERAPGRMSRALLAETTVPPSLGPRIFVSGPTSFVEAATSWMVDLGHDPAKIRAERFGGSR